MISRDAIYDWLAGLITAAPADTALKDALLFRNLRSSVDQEARKVIRVECWSGRFTLTEEPELEEQDVDFVIQCVVTPIEETADASDVAQLDAAKDESFLMAREIFRAMAPGGVPGVCQIYGDEWDQADPNFGTRKRGATYLYGKVNQ